MLFEILALCVSIFLFIYAFNRYSRKKCTAPGPPRGVPVLGNLVQMFDKQAFLKLCDWQKELGDVYKLNLFTEEVVVVNGDAVYEVLVTCGDDYGGRVQAARTKIYSNGFRNIGYRHPDKEWKTMRKIAQKGLKQYGEGVANIERISMEEIRECLDKFDKTEAFDPSDVINDMVIAIIITVSMGVKLGTHDPLHQKIKRAEKLFPLAFGVDTSYLDVVPWLRNLPNEAAKVFNDAIDATRQLELEIFQRSMVCTF
ncbi:unnamed protein product [Owenia fusiformis]|uniref:Cytochrome P450 n=1 Tax=Owenia fusiformis TaxID=6347 RepID=A0A8S4Q8D3_OWEFU|nr:unnamed protein product [Owenia fusiformis]